MFGKTVNINGCTFVKNLQGLYDHYFKQQGKARNWLKLVSMAPLSVDKKYL